MKIPFKGSPAGDSYSTNADLLRFAEALRSGKLLKPTTLAEMFKDPVPMGPGAIEAGFGERSHRGATSADTKALSKAKRRTWR